MKEELIKRFEKEHRLDDCGNIIETEIAESSLLAEKFTNWLIAVIADLEQENIKLAEDYLTAETQKIIAQEKYDKLKEENEEESKRARHLFHRSEIDRKALMSLKEKMEKL